MKRRIVNLLNIHRYLSNEATPAEKKELDHWINKSESNRKKFESYREIYDVEIQNKYEYDTEKALARFRLVMNKDQNTTPYRAAARSGHKLRKRNSAIWWKIAAMLLLTAGLSFYLITSDHLILDKSSVEEISGTKISTEPGEQKSFRLSDGSRIKLNADSELYIPEHFGEDGRVVELTGEAFFEISSIQNLSFEILTSSARVQVLGTKFGVRAWKDREESIITVLTGRVSVRSANLEIEESTILESGEYSRVTLNRSPTSARYSDIDQYVGWTDQLLVFEETPLKDVLKSLELHFNVQIDVEDSSSIEDPVTARYRNESLKEILEYTSITHGVQFNVKSRP